LFLALCGVVFGFQAYPKHEEYELQNYHNEDVIHSVMPKTERVYWCCSKTCQAVSGVCPTAWLFSSIALVDEW